MKLPPPPDDRQALEIFTHLQGCEVCRDLGWRRCMHVCLLIPTLKVGRDESL